MAAQRTKKRLTSLAYLQILRLCTGKKSKKVAAPPLASKRLLDQVRERIRYLHYSLKTEKSYLYYVNFFVL